MGEQPRPNGASGGQCDSCRVPVWWVRSERGTAMPLDVEPDARGNVVMVSRTRPVWQSGAAQDWYARVQAVVAEDEQDGLPFEVDPAVRWRPHWASCPDAPEWRRKT